MLYHSKLIHLHMILINISHPMMLSMYTIIILEVYPSFSTTFLGSSTPILLFISLDLFVSCLVMTRKVLE